MSLASILLNKRNRKTDWYEQVMGLPLTNEERETVEALFSRHNPTFAQAFTIREIERKYQTT